MKKVLFAAALLCGVSFASNAATPKAKAVATEKKTVVSIEPIKAAPVLLLFEETFVCPKQGWSLPVVGYTQAQVTAVLEYYTANLDC